MRKSQTWIGVLGIGGIVLALATGCSSAAAPEADLDGRPPKPAQDQSGDTIAQADTTAAPGPDCNRRDTPHSTFLALKHSDQAADASNGYWRAFPNSGVDAKVSTYESNVWSIYHTNGYEYLLKLLTTTQTDNKVFQYKPDHAFFAVGVGDQYASPAWIVSPPASPKYPDFSCWDACQGSAACYARNIDAGKCKPFKPTDIDYQREYSLATDIANRYNPSVPNELMSQQWTCATILDVVGNRIDFFVLMDEHDPSSNPW